jgi:hypothetical protein
MSEDQGQGGTNKSDLKWVNLAETAVGNNSWKTNHTKEPITSILGG